MQALGGLYLEQVQPLLNTKFLQTAVGWEAFRVTAGISASYNEPKIIDMRNSVFRFPCFLYKRLGRFLKWPLALVLNLCQPQLGPTPSQLGHRWFGLLTTSHIICPTL